MISIHKDKQPAFERKLITYNYYDLFKPQSFVCEIETQNLLNFDLNLFLISFRPTMTARVSS